MISWTNGQGYRRPVKKLRLSPVITAVLHFIFKEWPQLRADYRAFGMYQVLQCLAGNGSGSSIIMNKPPGIALQQCLVIGQ